MFWSVTPVVLSAEFWLPAAAPACAALGSVAVADPWVLEAADGELLD